MSRQNYLEFKGTVDKADSFEGTSKKGNPFYIVNFGLKQKIGKTVLIIGAVSFNMKKELPLKKGHVVSVEGAVLTPKNYKDKNGNWVNKQILECSNALITDETEGVVLQEKNESQKYFIESDFSAKQESADSSDIGF